MIKREQEAQDLISEVLNELVPAVAGTMGPGGSNALIIPSARGGSPYNTKDGVTVANHLYSEDPVKQGIWETVQQGARKTAEDAGDGTTTTTVLTKAIFDAGKDLNMNPIRLKEQILQAAEEVTEFLKTQGRPVETYEDLYHVALISTNGDEKLAKIVADVRWNVGPDGYVFLDTSKHYPEPTYEILDGVRWDAGFANPAFLRQGNKGFLEYENAITLIVGDEVLDPVDVVSILEAWKTKVLTTSHLSEETPLVIIGDKIKGAAMETLIKNAAGGRVANCVVQPPPIMNQGMEIMDDLALYTGGKIIAGKSDFTLKTLTPECFGAADRVKIYRDKTVIIGGHGSTSKVEERRDWLLEEAKKCKDDIQKDTYESRAAILEGKQAEIFLGSPTFQHTTDIYFRVEDALGACKCALKSGVLPGAGYAYNWVAKYFGAPHGSKGMNCLKFALCEPRHELVKNGLENFFVKDFAQEVNPDDIWSDSVSQDLYEKKIWDPLEVVVESILNASSVASHLLSTKTIIVAK